MERFLVRQRHTYRIMSRCITSSLQTYKLIDIAVVQKLLHPDYFTPVYLSLSVWWRGGFLVAKFPAGEVTGTRQHKENPCSADRICAT